MRLFRRKKRFSQQQLEQWRKEEANHHIGMDLVERRYNAWIDCHGLAGEDERAEIAERIFDSLVPTRDLRCDVGHRRYLSMTAGIRQGLLNQELNKALTP